MERSRLPVHRTIIVVDVQGFGDQRRTNRHQVAVRDGLYLALEQAFREAAVAWDDCHPEDRGDGVLFLAPADVSKFSFVDVLPEALAEALHAHNDAHCTEEQIKLRMALHAGEVVYDDHGVTGAAINLAFRLVDAGQLKDALADSPGVLALIASSWFYHEVIRNGPGSGPATYWPVQVAVKKTRDVGWICLPGQSCPPGETQAPDLLAQISQQVPADARYPDTARISGLPVLAPVADLPEIRGRNELLTSLGRLLRGPRGALVVLAGTGGVGKSAVAACLIQRAQRRGIYRRPPHVWWVSAADRASLTGGLVTVARQLDAPQADIEAIGGDTCDAPDRLWMLLNRVRRPWLLVLDNADDPSVLGRASPAAVASDAQLRTSPASPADGTGWLRGAGRGLVLVTSRDRRSGGWGRHARIIRVNPLEEGDGARVLLDGAPQAGTVEEARGLARRLGCLPLALHLAGSYLSSEAALLRSFREYLLALDELGSRHRLLTPRPDLDTPADERLVIMRTWEISLDALTRNGIPQARPLLRVLSCYAPARPIPLWLVPPAGLSRLLARTEPGDRLQPAETEQCFEDGLHGLLRMSLTDIRRFDGTGPGGRALEVHPMIADTNRAYLRYDLGLGGQLAADAALVFRTATELVTDAVRHSNADRVTDWPRFLVLGTHLHALLASAASHLDLRLLRDLVDAATVTARVNNWSGAIPVGESLSRAAVCAADRLGSDDSASLRARHELGWPLVMQGQACEAEAIYRDVLAARTHILGDSHRDTLATRHELAWVAASQGRWSEAENGYQEVLAARQRVLGDEHRDTLVTRYEFAWAIANQGRYHEAEQLLAQVLGASRNHFGEDHPRMLMIRHELAWTAANQGRWDEAERAYRELLAAHRCVLGDDHHDTLTVRHELAWALSAQGRHAAAVQHYSEALGSRQRTLGADDPDTMATVQALEDLRRGRIASPRHLT
jgi:tetratricopeptide (TPR) repeat protein